MKENGNPIEDSVARSLLTSTVCAVGLLGAVCSLGGCGDDIVGVYHGQTTIDLFRSASDDHPYSEQRDDTIQVRKAGSRYLIQWLGCEFKASPGGDDDRDFEPTKCTFDLNDGREVNLVVGPLLSPIAGEGTTTALFINEEQVVIDVVAGVTIDGVYYRPSYFRFEEDK